MSRLLSRCLLLLLIVGVTGVYAARAATGGISPAAATQPASSPAAKSNAYGKETVVLRELESLYEAVPFSHRRHAEMAEMWDGCTTCHHHTPATLPTTQTVRPQHPTQDDAGRVPACKSCHAADDEAATLDMPSLKAAYHRQCLNCHRDWMDSNACVACHAVKVNPASVPTTRPPSADDIVGRMHKPLTAPTTKEYTTRFTPADGAHVLFRHEEHVKDFGVKCVACHRGDSCATCHSAQPATAETAAASRPLRPGKTWKETHGACVACHQDDRCSHCHYEPTQTPPPPFRHEITGQQLDKHHDKLACGDCHTQFKAPPDASCGGSACHKHSVSYPQQRPGLYKAPATTQATPTSAVTNAATRPATRPTIVRIRRGGQ